MTDDFQRAVDPEEVRRLGDLASREAELGAFLEGYRARLSAMVRLRIDPRLRQRVDPSDVIQESFLEVTRRIGEYVSRPEAPFYVWVRFIAGQKLAEVHRRHLGHQIRDVRREVRPRRWSTPEASSIAIAAEFVDHGPSPSQVAQRQERIADLHEALVELRDIDLEIVALRHFEELANGEVAALLGISPSAASLRYVRALERLGRILLNREPSSSAGARS